MFALAAVQRWAARRVRGWRADRLRAALRHLPSPAAATASLVVLVGEGLALRSVAAVW